jgi:multiple sugar transport system substrate-binding protein
MQQIYPARVRIFFGVAAGLFTLAVVGCLDRPTTIDTPPAHPYAGVLLTLAVADPSDRDLARQLARSWAVRNGAEVRIAEEPFDGTADVGLISAAELPRWAEAGRLAEVPAGRRDPADPYRWDDLLPAYRDRLTVWRERTYALPVLGEGMVLVYRKDAFDGKDGRPAAPPTTWDELADVAAHLGPKSLPPLPAGPERFLAEFFSAAADYDRPAVGRNSEDLIREREKFFSFQLNAATGAPRLTAPAFVHVAELFARMQPYREGGSDPAAALRTGGARVGILSLAELGRVGPDAVAGLGIAALPGAPFTFDAAGKRVAIHGDMNRVPYLGWGGRFGVVSAGGTNVAAAWDFLADAGMPERAALDLVADPRWGAGPYRTSQLDARSRSRWYAYGLSGPETERLTGALHENLGLGVQNYRLRLRTPNHAELDAILDSELRTLLSAPKPSPAAAMEAVNKKWQDNINRRPADQWRELARKSLGF